MTGMRKVSSRVPTWISIAVIVPVGFYSKFYRGPGFNWVNDSLGGVFYEVFWCLVGFFLFPAVRTRIIAGVVLVVTCCLEFLQLWHPPLLESLRSHFLGATILGTTFYWTDFPYYFVGTFFGWLWISSLARRVRP
jgi:hypothetical protein